MAFLRPDIIDILIPWIQNEVKNGYDHINDSDYDGFDPNDLILFENFILTELEANRHTGIESDLLLDKAYNQVIGNIPDIVRSSGMLPPALKGELLRIWYEWWCRKILDYVHTIAWDEYLLASQEFITSKIAYLNRLNTLR